ncbi:MAG: hypothetical protein HWN65_22260 [Candidatus Helarchaeota archaeon]|nr:hypothetical protein [Candidatus Helarchaeota archaeon]
MDSEIENDFQRRPFLMILIGTAIAIGLVGIHAYIIYSLWDVAGWPLTSSKFQTGILIVGAAVVIGLVIIVLTLFAWRSRQKSYEDSMKSVRSLGFIIIILSLIGVIMAIYYGIVSLGNITDFPEYAGYFIGRTVCLWAASGALFLNVVGVIQVIRD